MLWMFGDFVQNTIIANRAETLIRFIPVKIGSVILKHAIFSTQHYCAIPRKHVDALQITFRDSIDGGLLNIREPIALTLHFRIKT